MAWFKTKGVSICGMAAAVPMQRLDAAMLTERFDENTIQKFIRSTGIASCRQTREGQTAGDLGYAAAVKLLDAQGIDRAEIGVMIFVSTSPDYRKPTTACVLQKRLDLPTDCACMDINHGRAGFIYGNQTMQALLQGSGSRYGLLILGETTSKVIDKNERNAMMFGDAGAAVLYEAGGEEAHETVLMADGRRFRSLIVPSGGFRDMRPAEEYYTAGDGEKHWKYNLYMDGMDIFNFSVSDVLETIRAYLSETKTAAADYDLFACHQANNYIIQRLAHKLRLPEEKVPLCLDRFGNTSSVSIPLVLCDHYGGAADRAPQRILAAGFGIGLAWGVTSFTLDPAAVLPVVETDEIYEEGVIR